MVYRNCFGNLEYIAPINENEFFVIRKVGAKYNLGKYYKHCNMVSTVYRYECGCIFDAVDDFENLTSAVRFLKSNFEFLI